MRHFSSAHAILLTAALVAGITGCDRGKPTNSPPVNPPQPAAAPTPPVAPPVAAPTTPPQTTAPPAPAAHTAITTDKLEPYECGTITRLHTLGGVFLASQPKPEDFAQAKKGGVKTVINLRHASEIKDFDEKQVVEAEGLAYIHLPWDGPAELTDAVFDQTREYLKTAARPILLHCSSANRVGAVWLPYRVLDGGLSWDAALAEAKTVGLKSPDYEAKAKDYIERHTK
ncbi:hypothetical protein PHYC_00543 [Phycisphaerales bacterium]|nr:hypothetical protein PHYC_00543 [Phycisphaerales bacterium]